MWTITTSTAKNCYFSPEKFKGILKFWRLGSLLLDSYIDFARTSFLIAFLILSVNITLDEGPDRLFSETHRSGAV